MTQSGLERFGAYQKSLELFDLVVDDMVLLQKDTRCYRLISQRRSVRDAGIEYGAPSLALDP
ncbi:hypothetical protein ACFLQR_04845 [Verrucomicrobiota bacterium]